MRSLWSGDLNMVPCVGLGDRTTLNPNYCDECGLFYADAMIDLESGVCLRCVAVNEPGDGPEDERELFEMD